MGCTTQKQTCAYQYKNTPSIVGQQLSASPRQSGWAEHAAETSGEAATVDVVVVAVAVVVVSAAAVVVVVVVVEVAAGVERALQVPASHSESVEHWQCLVHEPPLAT